jgi:hypothetical protein
MVRVIQSLGIAAGALMLAGAAPGVDEHTPPFAPMASQLPPTSLIRNAERGLAKTYGGRKIDVTDYHYDLARTGWNPTETDLTVASVSSGKFGLLTTLNVDGNVFAQPLLVSNFVMPDGSKHDVLIVVTGHNSVYAFDAQNYAVLWQVNLGTAQATADVGCSDVQPEYGISSTPVVLRTAPNAATIYLVAATEPQPLAFHTTLHALSLATGADSVTPVEISPSATLSDGSLLSFDPKNQWNRAGLALKDGLIYIGFGSHCDHVSNRISGWLLSYGTDLSAKAAFHTIETPGATELASIWMSGFAPAIASNGDVYVATGNGDVTRPPHQDWGQSVLRLPPSLGKVVSRFTPAAFAALNAKDYDFGSGGVMLVPNGPTQSQPELAVASGKEATLYLLDRKHLGGLKPNDTGAIQAISVGSANDGVRGGPAYFDGPAGPTIYLQISRNVLRSYALTTGSAPSLTASNTGTSRGGYGGSIPIVSSHGDTAGTGIVWVLRRTLPMELEAYDAVALGAPIYSAQAGTWSNTKQANAFLTVMEANGRVYVPGYGTVDVFGLTP